MTREARRERDEAMSQRWKEGEGGFRRDSVFPIKDGLLAAGASRVLLERPLVTLSCSRVRLKGGIRN